MRKIKRTKESELLKIRREAIRNRTLEDLGFELIVEGDVDYYFRKSTEQYILFDKTKETVEVHQKSDSNRFNPCSISVRLFHAIGMKIRELNWSINTYRVEELD